MIRRLAVARVPMVEDYGFLIRFLVLFSVWGAIAYTFRLYLDLTWRGLVLAGLFMVASVLVFVGLWTRSAMIALGAVVLLKAWVLHSRFAATVALLPLISALLPLGGLYSVDRLLQVRRPPVPYVPAGPALEVALPTSARVLFAALVLFMIGGPAYNEIFHHHSKLFRSWDMYHVIGKNLITVRFFRANDASAAPMEYMKVLGHHLRGPGVMNNRQRVRDDMRIIGTLSLDDVIARMCAAVPDPASLRLKSDIAWLKQGWRPLYHGDEAICDAQGKSVVNSASLDKGHAQAEEFHDVE